jgi:hypothetical protein
MILICLAGEIPVKLCDGECRHPWDQNPQPDEAGVLHVSTVIADGKCSFGTNGVAPSDQFLSRTVRSQCSGLTAPSSCYCKVSAYHDFHAVSVESAGKLK